MCRLRMLQRRKNGRKPFLSEEKLSKMQKRLLSAFAEEADPERKQRLHSQLSYVISELHNLMEGRDPLVDPVTEKQMIFSGHFME